MFKGPDPLSSGGKPLKHARSKAELHAIRQRNLQIALTALNVLVGILVLLHTYGIL